MFKFFPAQVFFGGSIILHKFLSVSIHHGNANFNIFASTFFKSSISTSLVLTVESSVTKVENHSNVKFVQEQQNNENREVNFENYCVQTL